MPNFWKPLNIHPWARNSLASKMLIGGDDSLSDIDSTAYPAANLAIYVPFFLQNPMIVDRIFWANGATVSGNIDVGIYGAGGEKIVTTGSTLQSGTSAIQDVNITNVTLGTGLFFLAVSMDNATGTLMGLAMGSLAYYKTLGCYQESSAFPLPSPATFGTPTSDFVPLIGITPRSSL